MSKGNPIIPKQWVATTPRERQIATTLEKRHMELLAYAGLAVMPQISRTLPFSFLAAVSAVRITLPRRGNSVMLAVLENYVVRKFSAI